MTVDISKVVKTKEELDVANKLIEQAEKNLEEAKKKKAEVADILDLQTTIDELEKGQQITIDMRDKFEEKISEYLDVIRDVRDELLLKEDKAYKCKECGVVCKKGITKYDSDNKQMCNKCYSNEKLKEYIEPLERNHYNVTIMERKNSRYYDFNDCLYCDRIIIKTPDGIRYKIYSTDSDEDLMIRRMEDDEE